MPIEMQPEPTDFFEKVQKPGEEFLTKNPYPKGEKGRTKIQL